MGILQNEGGHQPPPQRRRYVDCNQRILRIVDDFPNRQRIDYLRSIAHNLAYKLLFELSLCIFFRII